MDVRGIAQGLSTIAIDVIDGDYETGEGFNEEHFLDDISDLLEDCREFPIDTICQD